MMRKDFAFPQPKMRFAELRDVDALVQLVNSAYRGESSRQGWTTEADLLDGIRTHREHMAQQINNDSCLMMVAMGEENTIHACVYLEDRDPLLYLGMLTVQPDLQDRGIGKQLLQTAELYAKFLGKKGIQMTVISLRNELIAWYQRHGYQPTGETQPFPVGQALGDPRRDLEFMVLEKIF
jgi:N-acetylglutamate synthase-like GNAT family acetyltransferase